MGCDRIAESRGPDYIHINLSLHSNPECSYAFVRLHRGRVLHSGQHRCLLDADLLSEVDKDKAEEARRAFRQKKLDLDAEETKHKREAAKERRKKKEEEQNQRRRAVDEALEDIRHNEIDQAALLSQLSAQSFTTPLPSAARRPDRDYRVDQERNQVDIWAKLMDIQGDLKAELELLKRPPPKLPLGLLRAGVSKLEQLAHRSNALKRNLLTIRTAKGFASAQVLRDTAWENAKCHDAAVEDALAAWNAAILKELALRTNSKAATFDTSHLYAPILPNALAPVQVIMFMVVVCSTILSFSRRGCSWLFSMSQAAISEAFAMTLDRSPDMDKIEQTFPHDVPTAVKRFNLDTKSQIYAACPECHHIVAPLSTDPFPQYQERCNYQRYNRGKKCKTILTRPSTVAGTVRQVPIKPFVSFDFEDWLARLMAREGTEEQMDGKWEDLKKDPTTMTEAELKAEFGAELRDVFDGSVIRSFKGPDGKRHFKEPDNPGEGRYLFSLGFDFFNPLTNNRTYAHPEGRLVSRCLCTRDVKRGKRGKRRKTRKKTQRKKDAEDRAEEEEHEEAERVAEQERDIDSVGENRVEGEVEEPVSGSGVENEQNSVEAEEGAEGAGGRPTTGEGQEQGEKIMDPAFEGGEGNRVGYNDYDINSWKLRTGSQCREWAERYRTAHTQQQAQGRFDKTGLRWTEFLRLPYFDLPTMLVIDSMHNLFLGLLKEHFRHILGFRSTKTAKKRADPDPVLDIIITPSADNLRPTKPTEIKSLEKALKALSEPMSNRLKDPSERRKILNSGVWKNLHQSSAFHIAKALGCTDLYKVRALRARPGASLLEREEEGDVDAQPFEVTKHLIKKEYIVEKILDWRISQAEKVQEPGPEVELITEAEKEAFFPEPLKLLAHLLDKLLRPQSRNIFLDDESGSTRATEPKKTARAPDPNIVAAFKQVADSYQNAAISAPPKIFTPSSTTYNGVRYTTNSRHKGNSCILVMGVDPSLTEADADANPVNDTYIPMIIQTIVQDASNPAKICMAAKRVNAVALTSDPFEAYPILGAKIWSHGDDLDPTLEIVDVSEILCHFASCEMEVETQSGSMVKAAVVVPLRKSVILEYVDEEAEENQENPDDDYAMQL
ncbi:hypothetical protein B0H11DRAFT_1922347 [Mycena galericulata]|nr:hypothetical protein B0H11DRAFT_1922347 [Mycena galericulata]